MSDHPTFEEIPDLGNVDFQNDLFAAEADEFRYNWRVVINGREYHRTYVAKPMDAKVIRDCRKHLQKTKNGKPDPQVWQAASVWFTRCVQSIEMPWVPPEQFPENWRQQLIQKKRSEIESVFLEAWSEETGSADLELE